MKREIIFLFKNLRYDIDNLAYIVGQRTADVGLRQRISDVTQENNLDRVKRMLDLAYAEVNNLCYPYTKVAPVAPMGRDFNDISDKMQYVIHLEMPPTTAKSTLEVVRERINEYFIWRVMEDWLNLTAPDLARDYTDKTNEIGLSIQAVLTSRMRMTTIKPSTF